MSRKWIRRRRFPNHLLGWRYLAVQGGKRMIYNFKRDALIHARVMQKSTGGEWGVFRIRRNGSCSLIKMVGGYFDDWPGDNW